MYSGESNGLTIYLDIEAHDHGYLPAKGQILLVVYNIILLPYIILGSGVLMVVNHHGDKPILSSGRVKLEVYDQS